MCRVEQVAAGENHVAVRSNRGRVYLAVEDGSELNFVPVNVPFRVTRIACNQNGHTVAVTEEGQVYGISHPLSKGWPSYQEEEEEKSNGITVDLLNFPTRQVKVIDVCAGDGTTYFLTERKDLSAQNGKWEAWSLGAGLYGQLGLGSVLSSPKVC